MSAPRNFQTQYALRPRTQPGSPPRFNGMTSEAGPEIDKREPFADLIGSEGFRAMVALVIVPAIRSIRKELLQGEPDEISRIRLTSSLRTFERLLTKVYENAGEPMPSFLVAQFN